MDKQKPGVRDIFLQLKHDTLDLGPGVRFQASSRPHPWP
jgi:hypothetical protein